MKKILWIDDDEKLMDSCLPLFYNYGFQIYKATSTTKALNVLREEILDGVLLDVKLNGEENGIDLLMELRKLYPRLNITIFTGYPNYLDHVLSEELGASIYLHKVDKSIPFTQKKQESFFKALDKIFPKKKEKLSNKTIVVILFLVEVLLSIIVNIATNVLPNWIQSYTWAAWIIMILLIIVAIYLIAKNNKD